MTERKLRALLDYWVRRLNLTHWDIELTVSTHRGDGRSLEDVGANASTWRSNTYDAACVVFPPWEVGQAPRPESFEDHLPRTDQRVEQTLVHELLHLTTRDLRQACDQVLDDLERLNASLAAPHRERLDHLDEQLVDRLATALVDHAPASRHRT